MGTRRTKVGIAAAMVVMTMAVAACGPKKADISSTMTEYKYEPATWQVPAGAQVTLTLTNAGSLKHEWVLMKKGYTVAAPFSDAKDASSALADYDVDPGQTQTFTFTAPTETGDYEVVCGVATHLENGMKGTLTVQ
jgi:plastocyanin